MFFFIFFPRFLSCAKGGSVNLSFIIPVFTHSLLQKENYKITYWKGSFHKHFLFIGFLQGSITALIGSTHHCGHSIKRTTKNSEVSDGDHMTL